MNKPQEFTSAVNHQISGRERLLKALAHQEPDRVPIDLGSTQVTGIHVIAHYRLRQVLGLPPAEAQICDHIMIPWLPHCAMKGVSKNTEVLSNLDNEHDDLSSHVSMLR